MDIKKNDLDSFLANKISGHIEINDQDQIKLKRIYNWIKIDDSEVKKMRGSEYSSFYKALDYDDNLSLIVEVDLVRKAYLYVL